MKWRPEAFTAAALQPSTAHAARPAVSEPTAAAKSKSAPKRQGGAAPPLVVPDLAAAMAQMHALGQGLVHDVLLCDATFRLDPQLSNKLH